ncbi:MAG TPA: YfiR family protein [Desulfuromonadales bacterium]|nr:YfiR family protein [Desulfuromonadales bacterium]
MMKCLLAILVLILAAGIASGKDDDVPQEYLVKAKYLLNIPLYTEMLAQTKTRKSYTICLIGATPLESVLAASSGKLIKSRPLAVLKVTDFSQMDSCQLLFIASSERNRLQTLLPEAHSRGIVTISDMRDFARMGGMINLLTVNGRIVFDLNRSAAGSASISFSTHLLKLARDVIN